MVLDQGDFEVALYFFLVLMASGPWTEYSRPGGMLGDMMGGFFLCLSCTYVAESLGSYFLRYTIFWEVR